MIKQAKRVCLVLAVAALSGCGVGPDGGALSGSFDAPVGYQKAYQSALAQTQLCLLANGAYRIDSQLDSATRTGRLRVVGSLFGRKEAARVELTAINDTHTRVQVDMWGRRDWDASAMRAMRDAVVYSVASCRSYMPQPNDEWFRPQQPQQQAPQQK